MLSFHASLPTEFFTEHRQIEFELFGLLTNQLDD